METTTYDPIVITRKVEYSADTRLESLQCWWLRLPLRLLGRRIKRWVNSRNVDLQIKRFEQRYEYDIASVASVVVDGIVKSLHERCDGGIHVETTVSRWSRSMPLPTPYIYASFEVDYLTSDCFQVQPATLLHLGRRIAQELIKKNGDVLSRRNNWVIDIQVGFFFAMNRLYVITQAKEPKTIDSMEP